MACSVLKYLIFAAFLSQWQNAQGTRFQPSIIWDAYNKLISCKCNWMNIPQLDNYDRIELLCPSQILVSSTREHDVAKTRQYYDIFMRKFNMTNMTRDSSLEKLRKDLENGSFCDPQHNDTRKLYTCVRDDPEGSVKLRFHEQEDLRVNDTAVFFSNKGTGLQSDLGSTDKKCEMVFIAQVTAHERKIYDLSYGKCLLPSDSNCNNISQDCPCGNFATPLTPPHVNTSSEPGTETSGTPVEIQALTTPQPTPTRKTDGNTRADKRSGTSNDGFQILPLFVGLFIGIVITVFILIVFIYCKKKGKLQRAKNTVEKHELTDKAIGFPNKGFLSPTHTAPPAEHHDESDYAIPNKPQPSNGRLPSIERSESDNVIPSKPQPGNGRLPSIETSERPLKPITKETTPNNAAE